MTPSSDFNKLTTITIEGKTVTLPTVEKEEAGYCSKHQDYCHIKLELLVLVFVGKSMRINGRQQDEDLTHKHPETTPVFSGCPRGGILHILCLVAEKRYAYIAQDQIQVQPGKRQHTHTHKKTQLSTMSCELSTLKKTNKQKHNNNNKYVPVFLWQICFHIKEHIFSIFDLCFDVCY